jgi:hypothetical protein
MGVDLRHPYRSVEWACCCDLAVERRNRQQQRSEVDHVPANLAIPRLNRRLFEFRIRHFLPEMTHAPS